MAEKKPPLVSGDQGQNDKECKTDCRQRLPRRSYQGQPNDQATNNW